MRRLYCKLRNFLSTYAYWCDGYTWREARVKVCMLHIRAAIAKTDFAVYRTNRKL